MTEPLKQVKQVAVLTLFKKDGSDLIAARLAALGFSLSGSKGTAKYFNDHGVAASDVADLVGGGPILGHRVVTLSREIHAGLLAQDNVEDHAELESLKIPWIEIVFVDFYPIWEALNKPEPSEKEVIEMTDIGGPTIASSAAKGQRIIVVDRADHGRVLDWLEAGCPDRENLIRELAAKAWAWIAAYRGLSAEFHSDGKYRVLSLERKKTLGYPENRWIQGDAELFTPMNITGENATAGKALLSEFEQVGGVAPGFINYTDGDALLNYISHIQATFKKNFNGLTPNVAVAVKHGAACGVGVGNTPEYALRNMIDSNPLAIFGGSVGVSFMLDENKAKLLRLYGTDGVHPRVLDTVWASYFTEEAMDVLDRKNGKCRMMQHSLLGEESQPDNTPRWRQVRHGEMLWQGSYNSQIISLDDQRLEWSDDFPDDQTMRDLALGIAICGRTPSNTITLVRHGMLLGNGSGQFSRLAAANLALYYAKQEGKHNLREGGSVIAVSDSFFPFNDAVEVLIEAGVRTIFTTNISVNDERLRTLCAEKDVRLVWGADKDFRMFCRH